ncbi:MAG: 5-(carboxyamino)imidazole ribonucleotide mutase [Clostridium sp.]|nr:5-(carboxyamino)imidazole ribonucleotide mutase [Prevotella sp.]MCM1429204.1 5-(carboxyamino)imidazole ribonucleotide mutase [Clostridium sp.]MCM1475822.1 5-(carboxyamino)imidazole ribonucleotide mutase [Muribaculaceae bacterium]
MKIGVVMGSTSDLDVMKGAFEILDEFGIEYEKKVFSAHRTPVQLEQWASSARDRGMVAIIAGAGGAAHLPGVVAAHTTIPVIGVPVMSKQLMGLDSLLSIVQMPGGIPVATVGINGAKNAALLAAEILALTDKDIKNKIDLFRERQAEKVLEAEI